MPKLDITVVFMAGGEGRRLLPLTAEVPKPLLPVNGKPLLFRNIERLSQWGIDQIYISLHHQADKITQALDSAGLLNRVQVLLEPQALGTAGALHLLQNIQTSYVLLMNADILSSLDLANFQAQFIASGSDLMVATINYPVSIPYGVIHCNDHGDVSGISEKPILSYHINTGIYLFKHELLHTITPDQRLDATDWVQQLIDTQHKISTYEMLEYWLDIGSREDYDRAQRDFSRLQF
jgi:NDP-sugar pyrophosphorylase family protein